MPVSSTKIDIEKIKIHALNSIFRLNIKANPDTFGCQRRERSREF